MRLFLPSTCDYVCICTYCVSQSVYISLSVHLTLCRFVQGLGLYIDVPSDDQLPFISILGS